MDALECGPRDFRSLEIQQILMDACINKGEIDEYQQQIFSAKPHLPPPSESTRVSKRTIQWLWMRLMQCLNYNKSCRWFEDERGMLMVVATMISTMTFQAAINPPGGVWQENKESASIGGEVYCSKDNLCYAGTAVLGYVWETEMKDFTRFNTISFVGSLCVTIFLISGFPLTNRVCIWFLSMAMCVTITFAGLTYFVGVDLVMPYNLSDRVDSTYGPVGFYLWVALLALIGLLHTLRFLTWGIKKMKKSKFREMRVEEGNPQV
uniref:uncharacterized protein LOC105352902 n=1 Tax=Fragaria vesca subsp. vesca TaxID=101020 RepID=UPI0005C957DB|nr:PREDICTED: uncharacterized protein LOC105352902 [Fragaria vesca subsp. vesca]